MSETIAEESLTQRIAREFEECPALRVTLAQAARLWSMPADRAESILYALVADGRLLRTRRGEFVRRGGCPRCE